MVEGTRSRRLARRAEYRRILRNNPEYREAGNEQQRNRRSDPEYREAENFSGSQVNGLTVFVTY